MGRIEIKLRDQLSSSHIQRHRDYEVLMKQHKRSRLFRRTFRFFFYSLILTFVVLVLVMLSFYVIQMKKRQEKLQQKEQVRTSMMEDRKT